MVMDRMSAHVESFNFTHVAELLQKAQAADGFGIHQPLAESFKNTSFLLRLWKKVDCYFSFSGI
jgi:hypothetical protein